MSSIKYLKGDCSACGGHLEFPADSLGMSIDCPHCGQSTELTLAAPPDEPIVPRKTVVLTAIAIFILLLGLAGAFVALKLAKERNPPPTTAAPLAPTNALATLEDPWAKQGFEVSQPTLQKVEGSKLIYAVGDIANLADRQRFGVRVELELFDDGGKKIGTAKDYQAVIEPHGHWNFRALAVESKAASAKVTAIKEDQ